MKLNDRSQSPCLCYFCALNTFQQGQRNGSASMPQLEGEVVLKIGMPTSTMETEKRMKLTGGKQESNEYKSAFPSQMILNASCAGLWHGHFGPRKSQFLLWAVHHLALRSGVNSTSLQCCILRRIDENEWMKTSEQVTWDNSMPRQGCKLWIWWQSWIESLSWNT